jgi:O-antigen/teichoic acid export membrane protein
MRLFPSFEYLRRISIEGFWILFGQAMAVVGSLMGVRLLTELMSPAAFGELALGLTAATLVHQIVIGPLSNGIIRFYAPSVEQRDLAGYIRASRGLTLSATWIILGPLAAAVGVLLLLQQARWIPITIAAFVFAALSGYNLILGGMQNAARQRAVMALHQAAESWARIILAVALLVWLGRTGEMAILGYSIAAALILASQLVFFRRIQMGAAPHSAGIDWRQKILQYSWPFATWGLFSWAQSASDRWALDYYGDTQVVGQYAVLYQLGYYPLSVLTIMTMQLLAPILYQRAGDATDPQRNARVEVLSWRLTYAALGLTVIMSLLAFMFHREVFSLFAAHAYGSVSHLLPWMFLAGGIFAAGQTMALNLMSQMRTNVMMSAKIVTALLGSLLNFVGACWWGTAGVVGAGVAFSVVYCLWMIVLSRKNGMTLPPESPALET